MTHGNGGESGCPNLEFPSPVEAQDTQPLPRTDGRICSGAKDSIRNGSGYLLGKHSLASPIIWGDSWSEQEVSREWMTPMSKGKSAVLPGMSPALCAFIGNG